MTERERRNYTGAPGAMLAIEPRAYGLEFDCFMSGSGIDTTNPYLTVVHVDGPLSYDCFWWQSYDGVRDMVREACKADAPAVCLRINSPGGDMYGAFDCARDLRRICAEAGKRLIVHVEAQCASAAYALATAADEIVISSTASVGSIGVLCSYVDAREAAAQQGLRFTLISSGAFKTDGSDQLPIDEAMHARLQSAVDAAADEFFALVGAHRPALTRLRLKALEGRCLMGQAAVDQALADRVMSWSDYADEVCARGAIQAVTPGSADSNGDTMSDRDDIRAALAKQAESDDPVEAARAKKALAAYDEQEDDKEAKAKAEDSEEDKEAKAAASAKAEGDEPKDEEAKAQASAPGALAEVAGDFAAQLQAAHAEIAKLKARNEASDMQALLDSRPDVGADLKASLGKLSVADARDVLKSIPKSGAPVSAGARTPVATQGGGDPVAELATPEGRAAAVARMDPAVARAMGLVDPSGGPAVLKGSRFFVNSNTGGE